MSDAETSFMSTALEWLGGKVTDSLTGDLTDFAVGALLNGVSSGNSDQNEIMSALSNVQTGINDIETNLADDFTAMTTLMEDLFSHLSQTVLAIELTAPHTAIDTAFNDLLTVVPHDNLTYDLSMQTWAKAQQNNVLTAVGTFQTVLNESTGILPPLIVSWGRFAMFQAGGDPTKLATQADSMIDALRAITYIQIKGAALYANILTAIPDDVDTTPQVFLESFHTQLTAQMTHFQLAVEALVLSTFDTTLESPTPQFPSAAAAVFAEADSLVAITNASPCVLGRAFIRPSANFESAGYAFSFGQSAETLTATQAGDADEQLSWTYCGFRFPFADLDSNSSNTLLAPKNSALGIVRYSGDIPAGWELSDVTVAPDDGPAVGPELTVKSNCVSFIDASLVEVNPFADFTWAEIPLPAGGNQFISYFGDENYTSFQVPDYTYSMTHGAFEPSATLSGKSDNGDPGYDWSKVLRIPGTEAKSGVGSIWCRGIARFIDSDDANALAEGTNKLPAEDLGYGVKMGISCPDTDTPLSVVTAGGYRAWCVGWATLGDSQGDFAAESRHWLLYNNSQPSLAITDFTRFTTAKASVEDTHRDTWFNTGAWAYSHAVKEPGSLAGVDFEAYYVIYGGYPSYSPESAYNTIICDVCVQYLRFAWPLPQMDPTTLAPIPMGS